MHWSWSKCSFLSHKFFAAGWGRWDITHFCPVERKTLNGARFNSINIALSICLINPKIIFYLKDIFSFNLDAGAAAGGAEEKKEEKKEESEQSDDDMGFGKSVLKPGSHCAITAR